MRRPVRTTWAGTRMVDGAKVRHVDVATGAHGQTQCVIELSIPSTEAAPLGYVDPVASELLDGPTCPANSKDLSSVPGKATFHGANSRAKPAS
jgi:hypothetical protein